MRTRSCPTLCDPMDCSPAGSPIGGIFLGKNTGVGSHFFLQGILLTQRSNLRLLQLLHSQVDSLPLSHLGSPFSKRGGGWLFWGPVHLLEIDILFSISFPTSSVIKKLRSAMSINKNEPDVQDKCELLLVLRLDKNFPLCLLLNDQSGEIFV